MSSVIPSSLWTIIQNYLQDTTFLHSLKHVLTIIFWTPKFRSSCYYLIQFWVSLRDYIFQGFFSLCHLFLGIVLIWFDPFAHAFSIYLLPQVIKLINFLYCLIFYCYLAICFYIFYSLERDRFCFLCQKFKMLNIVISPSANLIPIL
jgi:hypothetical protein